MIKKIRFLTHDMFLPSSLYMLHLFSSLYAHGDPCYLVWAKTGWDAGTPAALSLAPALSELGCPEEDPRHWNLASNCHPLRHQGSRTPALHWHPLIIPAGHAQLPTHSGLLTSVTSFKASNADGVSQILILQMAARLPDTFQCNQGLWSHPEFSK